MSEFRQQTVTVACTEPHLFQTVQVRWNADQTAEIVFLSGKGPIEIENTGTGNHRRSRFKARRKP